MLSKLLKRFGAGAASGMFALGSVILLSGCSTTTAGKSREALAASEDAYNTASVGYQAVAAGKVPGVTLSDANRVAARDADNAVILVLQEANTEAGTGNGVTQTTLDMLKAAYTAYADCVTKIKSGGVCPDTLATTTTTK